MRKFLFTLSVILPMLALSGPSISASKGLASLVGEYSDWADNLSRSKEFGKKTVLLEVLDEKKSTTVKDLLDTVLTVLSPAQRNIFVDPLLVGEHQGVAHVIVEVDGAVVKDVGLRSQPPADQVGVAALVLSFKGDTTLPRQVLVNLKSK
jgi:hypothetical protein